MIAICPRCRREVTRTTSGHTRAHKCPHGAWCVVPYALRRRAVKREPCANCDESRQRTLFGER